MPDKIDTKPEIKANMHPRNSHKAGYDLKALSKISEGLKPFVKKNEHGTESIDFADPNAVKALNAALLKQYYGVDNWDIPQGYLCPPIPGRADYLHYIADLLGELNGGKAPRGKKIKVLDIGTGANLVYPLVGSAVYDWSFVGTDIDPQAIRSAKDIIAGNPKFQNNILLRQQTNKANIYKGVIKDGEGFDLTMCNPPFHASLQEAQISTATKWKKLGMEAQKTALNFGGQKAELWTPGGEVAFIRKMVEQSALVAKQVLWFTTLVSKKDSLPLIERALHGHKALEVKIISMTHGQKTSRIVAWTFQTPEERSAWKKDFWVDK